MKAPAAVAACDELLAALDSVREARERAVRTCGDLLAADDGSRRQALVRALRSLRKQGIPPLPLADPSLEASVGALAAATEQARARREALPAALRMEELRVGEILRSVARDPLFREALTWQNRAALHRGVDALLRRPAGSTDQKTRENERLVAKYLQRYCARNERIGFFGPLGWACIVPDAPEPVVVRTGAKLLATRKVFFEFWAIDVLAAELSRDPAIRPWIAPARLPTIWVEGDTILAPAGETTRVGPGEARLLELCDGARPARDVAAVLVAERHYADEAQVFGALDGMAGRKWLRWSLEVPAARAHPDRALERLLGALPGTEGRARGLEALGELEAARQKVVAAAGDAGALDSALDALDQTFVRVTSHAPTRRPGQAYAGRSIVFEDCRRDVEVVIGPEMLARLGPPLTLLVTSIRWYTFTLAARYRALFRDVLRALSRELGEAEVDFQVFRDRAWQHLPQMKQWSKAGVPVIDEVSREVRARWAELLGITEGVRRVERTVDSLSAGVAEAFRAPHPGWPIARFSSPDVLIGPGTLVLGEIHLALNTLVAAGVNFDDVPSAAELLQAWEQDVPPSPFLLHDKESLTTRISHESLSPRDYDVELGDAQSWRDATHVLPIGSLVVLESDGRPLVRQRGTGLSFDLMALLQYPLTTQSDVHFGVVPRWSHTPRVTIGDLVVSRETWKFASSECSFAFVNDPVERFVAAREWFRRNDLPRLAFAKIAGEKPMYVDFESPMYVTLLASLARRGDLTLSEMIPTIEEAWLPGPDGDRYMSELRMVVVDEEPYRWPPAAC